MTDNGRDNIDKAMAAFREAMLDVIETCRRTKTPLITEIDGEAREIPYDQIEKYIDIEALKRSQDPS